MTIAVIGGGLGGLAAARALVGAGIDAEVLEASSRVGGVIETAREDGYVRETAASSFLGGPADGMYSLCEALGVPLEKASPRAKARWIYIDGELRALPRGPIEFLRSDLLTWRGKLDVLREPLRPGRTRGDESVHDFAARRFGAEAARTIFAPFVTGVYAADAHDISLEAGFPRLAALDAQGGVVRGMLRSMLAGKHAKRTPRGMYAPAGGLGRAIDALAAGLRVRTDARASSIESDAGGVIVDGQRYDGAVLAIPAEDAAALVRGELQARLADFHRAPAALVYLGYRDGAVPNADRGFGALVARGEEARVLGVVFESTVWAERAPAGHVLLRCIFGGGRDPDAVAMGDDALIAAATRDVAHVLGAKGAPVYASVVRWRRGVAQYRVGHADRVRAAVAVARGMRVALAGADYRGPGVNDLAADAAVIADEVRAW